MTHVSSVKMEHLIMKLNVMIVIVQFFFIERKWMKNVLKSRCNWMNCFNGGKT